MIIERLADRLSAWKDDDLYRTLHCLSSPMETEVVDEGARQKLFCSNNYLGLANHPALRDSLIQTTERMGVGSGASQLVVGHTETHRNAEQAFAEFFGFGDALLFNTGYTANVGVIQALTTRDDVVYQDKLNHASLIDGSRMSDAKLRRYKHCDTGHLQKLLEGDAGLGQLLISDSVFSMEGDCAPLAELVALRKEFGLALMVDDAHGVGVLGEGGRGSLSACQLSPADVDLLVLPLGKAFGCFGAVVLGSEEVIDSLRQFTRSYIYTTAMPAALAAVAQTSLETLVAEPWRVERLQELIAYFRSKVEASGLDFRDSPTAIQSLIVGPALEAQRVSARLSDQGFLVSAIRPPTVPAGQSRLRFTLNVGQQEADIDELFSILTERQ